MENEDDLSYETLKRVYLGSYEHYKSVGAEVEHPEPGFELQGAKMANEVLVTKGALQSEVGHLDMLEHEVGKSKCMVCMWKLTTGVGTTMCLLRTSTEEKRDHVANFCTMECEIFICRRTEQILDYGDHGISDVKE
ncbi:hypothetical protein Tco_0132614 [Tanacetum coccineum]